MRPGGLCFFRGILAWCDGVHEYSPGKYLCEIKVLRPSSRSRGITTEANISSRSKERRRNFIRNIKYFFDVVLRIGQRCGFGFRTNKIGTAIQDHDVTAFLGVVLDHWRAISDAVSATAANRIIGLAGNNPLNCRFVESCRAGPAFASPKAASA